MNDNGHAPTTPARNEFLTARQLAAILQVSESTVRRLAREGRIPVVRITPRLARFYLPGVMSALNGSTIGRSPRHPTAAAKAEAQLSFDDLL